MGCNVHICMCIPQYFSNTEAQSKTTIYARSRGAAKLSRTARASAPVLNKFVAL